MTLKFYVNPEGRYIGGYDGALPPDGSIEVPGPPEDPNDIWDGEKYIPGPNPVPYSITIGQGREALYNAGLFDDVEAAIDAVEDVDDRWRIRNAWENRPTWERDSPFVMTMIFMLGLTVAQADQLFIDAAKL